MSPPKSSSDFAPLLKALRQIEYQLELKGASRILVAAAHVKEFKRQELAAHNIVTERPLQGLRVPARGRRHIEQSRLVSARWPQDKLYEVTMPAFNVVLKGQADMRIANYSVRCQPGDILFIPAGLPRSDGSQPDYVDAMPSSMCDILQFSPGLVAGLGLECSIGHSRGNKHISGSIDERCWVKNNLIAQLYYGICNELDHKRNTRSTFYLLMALLAQLQEEIKEGNAKVGWPFSSLTMPNVEDGLIRRAMKYINDHLEEPLTIDIVARQIGVSRAFFTREFRRVTGDTFRNYLINQRMKHAKVLLREANLPVMVVSKEVGLSPGRLRGLFRQKYQCTLDEFRKL